MNVRGISLFAVSALALSSCSSIPVGFGPLKTVERVDVERYMGRWYEIARFTHWFEKDIVGATADYALRPDGKITVVNSGFKGSLGGRFSEATAVAKIPDPAQPGRLKVSFFRPFYADYLIFALDEENYTWALVGSDDRKYLWFLSRTPDVDAATFTLMRELSEGQGYKLDGLHKVPQRERKD